MKKIIISLLICVIMVLSACGNFGTPETSPSPTPEKNNVLFGVGEPLASSNVKGFNLEIAVELTGMLGAKAYRMWFSPSDVYTGWAWDKVLSDEFLSEIPKSTKTLYQMQIDKLKQAGVTEITGLGQFLPRVASTVGGSGNVLPRRDTSEGSDYMQFLSKVKIIWKAVASAFPDITIWEVGNELNHMNFASFWGGVAATYTELAQINTDYIFYAYEGVKEGNPDAIVLTPGYAPIDNYILETGMPKTVNSLGITSIKVFLEMIYDYIKSGDYPAGREACTDPDRYFDGVAYHPYDLGSGSNTNAPDNKDTFDIRKWINANNLIYDLMCENGDEDKQVWFTEFGLTTKSHQLIETDSSDMDIKVYYVDNKYYKTTEEFEEIQSYFVEKYFEAMQSEEMHYVRTCHFFRLFGCTLDYSWNGFTVLYYGMFFEPESRLNRGFYPRDKAYTIQRIYGGSGDLKKYAEYSQIY